MTYVEEIVSLCLSQDGDRYIFGAEASASDTNPSAFDCSELIQWACARALVVPTMPDGSWIQARHCRNHGTLISVSDAVETRGALLFKFASSPFSGGRPSGAHVAMSLGNGRTIEARSTYYGVGSFYTYYRGWTHAALIPGVDYGVGPVVLPPDPVSPQEEREAVMQITMPVLRLFDGYVSKGKGQLQGDVSKLQGCLLAEGLIDENTDNPRTYCDGLLGPYTEGNVKKFQQIRSIEVDGIVGSETWMKLLNQ